MAIANLVLPIFAVILTGWLAGVTGYLPRSLAAALVQFAYSVAMPALVFLTIAQEPMDAILDAPFLTAFGGGSITCLVAVSLSARLCLPAGPSSSAMMGAVASMTNTGFVALPILQALYGEEGVLLAATATVFVGVIMFPLLVVVFEIGEGDPSKAGRVVPLLRQVALNPVVISTLSGIAWSMVGQPLPSSVAVYTGILGKALTPCALFAIGLGLSLAELRGSLRLAGGLTLVKLFVLPAMVYALCLAIGLPQLQTTAAVVCAAVPTAKTAYILAGTYEVEQSMAATTVSLSTVLSVITLLAWLSVLPSGGVPVR